MHLKDGAEIARDRSGKAAAVILVAAALPDRSAAVKMAARLAEHYWAARPAARSPDTDGAERRRPFSVVSSTSSTTEV